MYYNDFCGNKVSALGFGLMRLPKLPNGNAADIDEKAMEIMVDEAISNGVNYFDTAFPYHDGVSEIAIGKILKKYPRESFFLATKYPGHQVMSEYDPKGVFETQLKKCQVEYFDYYLMHNICEFSLPVYNDPKWGIIDYFVRMKQEGKIKHLGFSSHATPETLKLIFEKYGDVFEFCQIQLNYLDWELQEAEEKYEFLEQNNIPIIVMEPLRGGKLAALPDNEHARIEKLCPGETDADMSFRFLQSLPDVKVILSGMSSPIQMTQNIETFKERRPVNEEEKELLFDIAENIKAAVPCTACRYCVKGCPKGLDIPELIKIYNDLKYQIAFTGCMQMDVIPKDKWPSACIGCGACAKICPQKIDIPDVMKNFASLLDKDGISWAKVCKDREEAAKKLKNK